MQNIRSGRQTNFTANLRCDHASAWTETTPSASIAMYRWKIASKNYVHICARSKTSENKHLKSEQVENRRRWVHTNKEGRQREKTAVPSYAWKSIRTLRTCSIPKVWLISLRIRNHMQDPSPLRSSHFIRPIQRNFPVHFHRREGGRDGGWGWQSHTDCLGRINRHVKLSGHSTCPMNASSIALYIVRFSTSNRYSGSVVNF